MTGGFSRRLLQPRQGRKILAQGVSLGNKALTHRAAVPPLPAGERVGVWGAAIHPRLTPWAKFCRSSGAGCAILRSGVFTPPPGMFDVRIHRKNRDVCARRDLKFEISDCRKRRGVFVARAFMARGSCVGEGSALAFCSSPVTRHSSLLPGAPPCRSAVRCLSRRPDLPMFASIARTATYAPPAPWAKFCRSSGAGCAILRSGAFTPPPGMFDVRIHRKHRDVCATRDLKFEISDCRKRRGVFVARAFMAHGCS